jgi:hypothetical protein
VLGSVGLLAVGAAVYLDLSASSEVDDLRKTCAPRCEPSQVDAVRMRTTVAGVTAGIGAVSLGVAAYLFLTPRHAPEQAHLHVELAPLAHGAHASLGWAF